MSQAICQICGRLYDMDAGLCSIVLCHHCFLLTNQSRKISSQVLEQAQTYQGLKRICQLYGVGPEFMAQLDREMEKHGENALVLPPAQHDTTVTEPENNGADIWMSMGLPLTSGAGTKPPTGQITPATKEPEPCPPVGTGKRKLML